MATSKTAAAKARRKARQPSRTQDPEGTRQNIIEIASEEFALNGLSGARIDEIAARTRSCKRMIYYYFGDKEGLYLSALENAYRTVREGESKLDIAGLSPLEALQQLVEFTFDHHHKHEAFIRMVMIENIHHGEYLEKSKAIRDLNVTAIDTIESVYARGVKDEALPRRPRPARAALADQRALLLQRLQPRHLLQDLRAATSARRRRRSRCARPWSTWCCTTSCGRKCSPATESPRRRAST